MDQAIINSENENSELDTESHVYPQRDHKNPMSDTDNTDNNNSAEGIHSPSRSSRQKMSAKEPQIWTQHKNNPNDCTTKVKDKIPSDVRPKPFTPYTSFLSQTGISESSNNTSLDFFNVSADMLSDKLKTSSPKKEKLYKKNKQILNPFNKRNSDKLVKLNKLELKKTKKNKAKERKSHKLHEILIGGDIDESHVESDSDDDVILVPTLPQVPVIIDSSDDDNDCEATVVSPNINLNMASPPSSIVSDDFIDQLERSHIINVQPINDAFEGADIDFDNFNNTFDELEARIRNSEAGGLVDSDILTATNSEKFNRVAFKNLQDSTGDDVVIVSEICPESIYAPMKRAKKQNTNSDSIQDSNKITGKGINRSKRYGNTSASDVNQINVDLDELDDSVEILPSSQPSNPSNILLGEAIENAINITNNTVNQSQQLMTSTTVSQYDDDTEDLMSESTTTVTAREIVEYVLQHSNNEQNLDIQPTDDINKLSSDWIVTDEIGDCNNDNDDSNNEENMNSTSNKETWIITDAVGVTDGIDESVTILTDTTDNIPNNESISNDKNITNGENIHSDEPSDNNLNMLSIDNQETVENTDIDKIDNSVQSYSLVDPELGWNEEMKCFYYMSWGGEKFRTKILQRTMPSYPIEWRIKSTDKYPIHKRIAGQFKCTNCMEFGHKTNNCYLPYKHPPCIMCGQIGHKEPRCPNKICLNCGAKSNVYGHSCNKCQVTFKKPCDVCKTLGHAKSICPDLWRRYHSTIQPNEVPRPAETTLHFSRRYCCVCAERGHTSDNCKSPLRILDYQIGSTKITDYSPTYDHIEIKNPEQNRTVPYALFSIPSTPDFKLNIEKPKSATFYSRVHDEIFTHSEDVTDVEKEIPKIIPFISRGSKLKSLREKILQRKSTGQTTATSTNTVASIPAPSKPHLKRSQNELNESQSLKAKRHKIVVNPFSNVSDSITRTSTDAADSRLTTRITGNKSKKKIIKNIFAVQDKFREKTRINLDDCNDVNMHEEQNPEEIDKLRDGTYHNFSFSEAIKELDSQLSNANNNNRNTNKRFDLSFLTTSKKNKNRLNRLHKWKRPITDTAEILLDKLRNEEAALNSLKDKIMLAMNKQRSNDLSDKCSVIDDYHDNDDTDDDTDNDTEMLLPPSPPAISTDPSTSYVTIQSKQQQQQHEQLIPNRQAAIGNNLPEFIPLETQMENNNVAMEDDDDNDNNNKKTESKIFLTKDNFNYLLTKQGNHFLSLSSKKFNIILQVEWRHNLDDRVLLVTGKPIDQERFHTCMLSYFAKVEAEISKRQDMQQCIPKNRLNLIKCLREHFTSLTYDYDTVKNLFNRLRSNERNDSKNSQKIVQKARRQLNLILFGQGLLGDGKSHLDELIKQLKLLLESNDDVINRDVRYEIYEHFKYIFTSYKYSDEDYEKYVNEYETLRQNNKLETYLIDKRLLGLNENDSVSAATSTTTSTITTVTSASPNDNKKLFNPTITFNNDYANVSESTETPSKQQNKQDDNTIKQLADALKSHKKQFQKDNQEEQNQQQQQQQQQVVSQHNQLFHRRQNQNNYRNQQQFNYRINQQQHQQQSRNFNDRYWMNRNNGGRNNNNNNNNNNNSFSRNIWINNNNFNSDSNNPFRGGHNRIDSVNNNNNNTFGGFGGGGSNSGNNSFSDISTDGNNNSFTGGNNTFGGFNNRFDRGNNNFGGFRNTSNRGNNNFGGDCGGGGNKSRFTRNNNNNSRGRFNNEDNQISLNFEKDLIFVVDCIIENRNKNNNNNNNNNTIVDGNRNRQMQKFSSDDKPSDFWSRKCEDFVQRCKYEPKIRGNTRIREKLNQISLKSRRNDISFNDYSALTNVLRY